MGELFWFTLKMSGIISEAIRIAQPLITILSRPMEITVYLLLDALHRKYSYFGKNQVFFKEDYSKTFHMPSSSDFTPI